MSFLDIKTSHLQCGSYFMSQIVSRDAVWMTVVHTLGEVVPGSHLVTDLHSLESEGWPELELRRLHQTLTPVSVGIALKAQERRATICSAGDMRVYLSWDGNLQACTRDHILTNDLDSLRALPGFERMNDLDLSVHANVVTRFVSGGPQALGPETVEWKTPGDYDLLISSSELNGDGPPESSFRELSRKESLGDWEGFLAKISVRHQ